MFLAAVGRPRFGEDGAVLWDGKIGIFPFTYEEKAKRCSKNRPAGTMETKPTLSVTRNVIKELVLQKVLPAIRQKWPDAQNRNTIIQQDNARPHIKLNDADFVTAATKNGWNIKLSYQPANSPDLNVLDLGFFRAIDSLKEQKCPKTIGELTEAVTRAYDDLTAYSLNKVFLSFQCVMEQILMHKGGNNYKLKHIGKDKLARKGMLPLNMEINPELVEEAKASLVQMLSGAGTEAVSTEFISEDQGDLQE
ncbi:unnamed protein product [Cuscuta epithymum]|uniref:Transposase n=1 Tax=Cuscuta epithymum TaxID=186058 RepID=A0AAV0EVK5_9ASTE|nr:unnamed protein product [Cuscuta epithymum]